ncbi:MAG: hypothetical protein V1725_00510 [archaeon]
MQPHENTAFIEQLCFQQLRQLSVKGKDWHKSFDYQFSDQWVRP